jgi:hypothetical protein
MQQREWEEWTPKRISSRHGKKCIKIVFYKNKKNGKIKLMAYLHKEIMTEANMNEEDKVKLFLDKNDKRVFFIKSAQNETENYNLLAMKKQPNIYKVQSVSWLEESELRDKDKRTHEVPYQVIHQGIIIDTN